MCTYTVYESQERLSNSIFCQMQLPASKLAPGGADARPGKFKIERFY